MNSQWREFLVAQGATFEGERISGFKGNMTPPAPEETVLADLSHAGEIAATGVDAISFLQGQISTDTLELNADTSQFSSWSNAKGRVITLLRLWQCDETLYLSLPQALLPSVLKRLSMYVLRAKVTLTEASDRSARFGLAGKDAEVLLSETGAPVPRHINQVTRAADLQIIRLHGDVPRYAIHGTYVALSELWRALLEAGTRTTGEDGWALRRILASEPSIYPETSEHFVAQMLNLEELGAIDFKKGCYTGQEVIARAHYRGAVKRHMLRAETRGTEAIRPGTAVLLPRTDQAVAEVVDARRDAAGNAQMLLVVQDGHRNSELTLPDGSSVTLLG